MVPYHKGEGDKRTMKFEVTKQVSIEEIEKAQKENLEFVIEDGKLFCLVPEE